MTISLPVVLFNFKNGGQTSPGNYNFELLRQVFGQLPEPPALIVLCEAKEWGYWGRGPLYSATRVISECFNIPYQADLAYISRGDFGPAILFNPYILQFAYWGSQHSSVPDDRRNLARFWVWNTETIFGVLPEHWDFRSGRSRLPYAERIESYGREALPILVAGDLNESPSGLHMPQIDWARTPVKRRKRKGKKLADGTWGPHTDAVDWLVGEWDERFPWGHPEANRRDSAGFHMVAELAALSGTPPREAFTFTGQGSRMLVDIMLLNDAWLQQGGLVPMTYRVIGADIPDWPSDHYLVSATLYL